MPSSPAEVTAHGGKLRTTGHTEWTDGRVHQTGFTTVFPPNTRVPYAGGGDTYDVDFNSSREGQFLRVTYAAVTARSYHPGVVNALLTEVTKTRVQAAGDRFVPALGYAWLTPLYDLVVALTVREQTLRALRAGGKLHIQSPRLQRPSNQSPNKNPPATKETASR